MRSTIYTFAVCLLAVVFAPQSLLAVSAPMAPAATASNDAYATVAPATATAPTSRATARSARKATRAERRSLRKQLREAMRNGAAPSTNTLLLIIVAILLAPLAMFLYEGAATKRFWISLLLWFLFILPGIIYTIFIIGTGK